MTKKCGCNDLTICTECADPQITRVIDMGCQHDWQVIVTNVSDSGKETVTAYIACFKCMKYQFVYLEEL